MLVRFDNGAKGSFSVGQVCAGHKNDLQPRSLRLARRRCRGSRKSRTSCGSATATSANEILQKDPSLLDAEVRGYAHLPGGHQEAWADAFCNLMRDIYGFIAAGKKPTDRASAGVRHVRRRLSRQLRRRSDSRRARRRQRLDEGDY